MCFRACVAGSCWGSGGGVRPAHARRLAVLCPRAGEGTAQAGLHAITLTSPVLHTFHLAPHTVWAWLLFSTLCQAGLQNVGCVSAVVQVAERGGRYYYCPRASSSRGRRPVPLAGVQGPSRWVAVARGGDGSEWARKGGQATPPSIQVRSGLSRLPPSTCDSWQPPAEMGARRRAPAAALRTIPAIWGPAAAQMHAGRATGMRAVSR